MYFVMEYHSNSAILLASSFNKFIGSHIFDALIKLMKSYLADK